MSHIIHTTEAVILDHQDFGEANRWCFLLTPDFGLVVARAQGVRELKSKLGGHLSRFSQAQISLVRGRECWRLIGADEVEASRPGLDALQAMSRIAGMLRRLLPEAGADPELFSLVKQGFLTLPEKEVALVWNILRLLGYMERAEIGHYPEAVLIQEINQALSDSML
jgi:recombinational DNA repair protein (RecF pathway)